MTADECKALLPGTKLLIGNEILEGEDEDALEWLGKVVTFDRFEKGKWVYFKEDGNVPFRYDEIVGIYNPSCIDDENTPYQSGDISLIFGEVC